MNKTQEIKEWRSTPSSLERVSVVFDRNITSFQPLWDLKIWPAFSFPISSHMVSIPFTYPFKLPSILLIKHGSTWPNHYWTAGGARIQRRWVRGKRRGNFQIPAPAVQIAVHLKSPLVSRFLLRNCSRRNMEDRIIIIHHQYVVNHYEATWCRQNT